MRSALCPSLAVILLAGPFVSAQKPPSAAPPGTAQAISAPRGNEVAASVNGQPVYEMAVQRALRGFEPTKRNQYRDDVINLLVDNLLVEQYLTQMKVTIDDGAVEKRIEEIRAEAKRDKKDFDQQLKESQLSVEELRGFVKADLRWEAFAGSQADDVKLKAYFEANKEMFDGSEVKARHILLAPAGPDQKSDADALAKLQAIKRQIESEVAAGLKKLPDDADKLAREKERARLVEASFSAYAHKESSCPSKEVGGDVGWFRRAGPMVEPFTRAAYASKPFEITDPIKTQFGYHLILVTERKAGTAPKYDDIKLIVKNVYGEKLREAVVVMMRPRSKIEITPVKP
jgi:parvulin-like peptidyl-prolyl isomerase